MIHYYKNYQIHNFYIFKYINKIFERLNLKGTLGEIISQKPLVLLQLIKPISTTISNNHLGILQASHYDHNQSQKYQNQNLLLPNSSSFHEEAFQVSRKRTLVTGKHLCRHVLDVARVSLIALVLSNQTVACHVCKVTYASGFKVATARHSSMLFSHTSPNDSLRVKYSIASHSDRIQKMT